MKDTPENRIKDAIKLAIGALPDLLLVSAPVGTFYTKAGTPIDIGIPGEPDFRFTFKGNIHGIEVGISGGFEVKVPGKKPRPNQAATHALFRSFGIQIYTVHSADEAFLAVADLRAKFGGK